LIPKIIHAELPYPSVDGLTTDLQSVKIISPAYAAPGPAEMSANLQYVFQHFIFEKLGMDDIAETILGISLSEMLHLDLIGSMISFMGVTPIYTANPMRYTDFYSARNVKYATNPQKMIIDDIADEFAAIDLYKSMVAQLKNEQVSAVISRIILDEKVHIETLKDILKQLTT